MMKLTITSVTGIGIAVAVAILSAPLANSGPEQPDAPSVIKKLQSEGYTVNIDRVGTKALDQCKVIGVRNPQTITRTDRADDRGHTLGQHRTTKIISKSVSVALDCT